jgi:mannose-6-phosphate isomerase-like protein (cupin superfamily)
LIITETYPGGGPPLHVHECEEAYVLLEGTLRCIQGEQRYDASAPCIVKIPAGVPHTFVNIGERPIRLVAAFPASHFTYVELGPNPLIET